MEIFIAVEMESCRRPQEVISKWQLHIIDKS